MKKAFSVNKFEDDMSLILTKEEIEESKLIWANDFDGLTADEIMNKYKCIVNDDWMIEVEGERK